MMEIITDQNILHQKSKRLTKQEIVSDDVQKLIDEMFAVSEAHQYSAGLSAIQLGKPLAISIVTVKARPGQTEAENLVCINTEIIETRGDKVPMWEGCSSILGDDGMPIYAQVPRFKTVRVRYFDREAKLHEETLRGFVGHVIQHETDHLNGVIISDLVDAKDFISNDEYCKMKAELKKAKGSK